jgi:hypothetical protein
VQAHGNSWGRLIFKDLVKFDWWIITTSYLETGLTPATYVAYESW